MEKFPISTEVTFVEMGMVHDNLTGPCTNMDPPGFICPTPITLHVGPEWHLYELGVHITSP